MFCHLSIIQGCMGPNPSTPKKHPGAICPLSQQSHCSEGLATQCPVCFSLFALGPFSSDCIVPLMRVVLQFVEIHARPSLNSPISPAAVLISVFRNGPHGLVPCICKYERLPFLPLVCFLYDWPSSVALHKPFGRNAYACHLTIGRGEGASLLFHRRPRKSARCEGASLPR